MKKQLDAVCAALALADVEAGAGRITITRSGK